MFELLRNQLWSRKFGLSSAAILLSIGVLILFGKVTKHSDMTRFAGDEEMRLMQRTRVKCPAPGPDTLVLVGMGQSNAGNWGEIAVSAPKVHADVFEYWQGNCYLAISPMLGATGDGTSLWPELGRSIIELRAAKRVVFQIFSVDGAPIKRFVSRDDLWPQWQTQIRRLIVEFPIDYYLWLQGEADFARGTSAQEYTKLFIELFSSLREIDQTAIVFVPIQSYCANIERWAPNNSVSSAQAAIPSSIQGTLAGVDSDEILSAPRARWDGCHPSSLGYAIWAEAWASKIVTARAEKNATNSTR